MPRIRKGSEVEKNGNWYARVRWTEENGKRRDVWIPANNKSHAGEIVKKKIQELETVGERALDGDRVKFSDLAKSYKEKKLIPAKFVGDRKIAGLKSYKGPQGVLEILNGYFGKKRIKSIKHSDIEQYKLVRLETPTNRGQRQIAGVNRELELLRAMFRFAIREGWLIHSPFEMGDPLISKADEVKRERTLSFEEEKRLLDACLLEDKQGRQRRLHLIPFLIAALDTACRRGELFKLRWSDVDLDNGIITIRAMNSKTSRKRTVGITPRLKEQLESLWREGTTQLEDLVFGLTCTIKTAWKSLCEDAKLADIRLHDLRHTAITRMVQTKHPSAAIMKISGHTQFVTFSRYVNPDSEMVTNIADALAELNAKANSQSASEMVN
ncbi:MAG TPA: site-specific integrase [Blastocatellia bacterium]|jgi:integrase|nr:site-specific integrase [Blastocatellia bacterium]